MTDVSKAIYSGDWELYPREGKVYIQDFTHPKIVLTDAEASHVLQVLRVWDRRKKSPDIHEITLSLHLSKRAKLRVDIAEFLIRCAAKIYGKAEVE